MKKGFQILNTFYFNLAVRSRHFLISFISGKWVCDLFDWIQLLVPRLWFSCFNDNSILSDTICRLWNTNIDCKLWLILNNYSLFRPRAGVPKHLDTTYNKKMISFFRKNYLSENKKVLTQGILTCVSVFYWIINHRGSKLRICGFIQVIGS